MNQRWRFFSVPWARGAILILMATGFLPLADAQNPSVGGRPARPEAIAETRLLMEGLAQPNHRGLEQLLKARPTDAAAWVFARGQALLIAETANLLLLRPPRNAQGEKAWMTRSMELRDEATTLARHLGNRDFAKSQASLGVLTATCNRCHQTFRVAKTVGGGEE